MLGKCCTTELYLQSQHVVIMFFSMLTVVNILSMKVFHYGWIFLVINVQKWNVVSVRTWLLSWSSYVLPCLYFQGLLAPFTLLAVVIRTEKKIPLWWLMAVALNSGRLTQRQDFKDSLCRRGIACLQQLWWWKVPGIFYCYLIFHSFN